MSREEEEIHSPEMEAKKPPKQLVNPKLLQTINLNLNWRSTVALYLAIGILSFCYGIFVFWANTTVTELIVEYDKICKGYDECLVSLTVPEKMPKPVFVYYGLSNFYQNHRLYLVSRSLHQLEGKEVDDTHIHKECSTATTNRQMELPDKNEWGFDLPKDAVARPCGLIAKAVFTDRYELHSSNRKIEIDEKDIVWPKSTYKNVENWKQRQWTDVEDEHFQVWMKTGVFSDGRKLWGRIQEDLEPGDYFMKIQNKYNVEKFNGQKYFVLTTSNIFGGKVEFLASTFLVIGMVFLMISLCFFNRSKETKKVKFNVRGVTD